MAACFQACRRPLEPRPSASNCEIWEAICRAKWVVIGLPSHGFGRGLEQGGCNGFVWPMGSCVKGCRPSCLVAVPGSRAARWVCQISRFGSRRLPRPTKPVVLLPETFRSDSEYRASPSAAFPPREALWLRSPDPMHAEEERSVSRPTNPRSDSVYHYRGQTLSRLQCRTYILSQASQLARLLKPGDRVVLALNDSPSLACLFLACIAVGAIPAVINPKSREQALADIAADCQASLVVREADAPSLSGPFGAVDCPPDAPCSTISRWTRWSVLRTSRVPSPGPGGSLFPAIHLGFHGAPKG